MLLLIGERNGWITGRFSLCGERGKVQRHRRDASVGQDRLHSLRFFGVIETETVRASHADHRTCNHFKKKNEKKNWIHLINENDKIKFGMISINFDQDSGCRFRSRIAFARGSVDYLREDRRHISKWFKMFNEEENVGAEWVAVYRSWQSRRLSDGLGRIRRRHVSDEKNDARLPKTFLMASSTRVN